MSQWKHFSAVNWTPEYTDDLMTVFTISLCDSFHIMLFIGISLSLLNNNKCREAQRSWRHSHEFRPSNYDHINFRTTVIKILFPRSVSRAVDVQPRGCAGERRTCHFATELFACGHVISECFLCDETASKSGIMHQHTVRSVALFRL